jgi:hypothetical protein
MVFRDIGESFGPFDLTMVPHSPLGRHSHGPRRSRSQLSRFGRPRIAHARRLGPFDLAPPLEAADRERVRSPRSQALVPRTRCPVCGCFRVRRFALTGGVEAMPSGTDDSRFAAIDALAQASKRPALCYQSRLATIRSRPVNPTIQELAFESLLACSSGTISHVSLLVQPLQDIGTPALH